MTTWAAKLKYRRTPKGCLMRAYQYAKRRIVEGRGLYLGLGICDRKDFYAEFETDPRFLELHRAWIESGYQKSERPTPDRADTKRGYLVDNIVWETYETNTYRALNGYNRERAEQV